MVKNKKTWTIPVSWEECGVIKVEAESLEEALKIAEDPYGEIALPEGNYIDASWRVSDLDTEAIRTLYNEGQKDCKEDGEVKCMYCGTEPINAE